MRSSRFLETFASKAFGAGGAKGDERVGVCVCGVELKFVKKEMG